MDQSNYMRWGLLLDVLADISNVERQVVIQLDQPTSFVPDDLLERWSSLFQNGSRLREAGVSDHMLAALIEFDLSLEDLMDYLPDHPHDKEDYLQHNPTWRAVCEMADWTLSRIAQMSMPEDPLQSTN